MLIITSCILQKSAGWTRISCRRCPNCTPNGTRHLENVNGILSGDTNSRFVGCENLDAPPPKDQPKRRFSRARRFLEEEYVVIDETEDHVDVTGVDFEELDIVSGGMGHQGSCCPRLFYIGYLISPSPSSHPLLSQNPQDVLNRMSWLMIWYATAFVLTWRSST